MPLDQVRSIEVSVPNHTTKVLNKAIAITEFYRTAIFVFILNERAVIWEKRMNL